MNRKIVIGGGLAALLVVGAAVAAPELTRAPLDVNGDGAVTLPEMQQRTAERFKRMDADSDGKVTKAEREANREKWRGHRRGDGERHRGGFRGERSGEWFGRLDSDGDGVVTVAELNARAAERNARIDANKDGKVTREEFAEGRSIRGRHRE